MSVVYLNAAGTLGGNGSGSDAANPVDCSTASKYDTYAFSNFSQGSDTPSTTLTIIYAAGTYHTRGSLFDTVSLAKSGNIHQGAGIDQTIIQLVNSNSKTNDGVIFSSNAQNNQIHNFALFDMTLDANSTGNPKGGDCFDQSGQSPAGAPTGRITTVNRGTWSGATAYVLHDMVTGSDGQLWILFVASNTGTNPVGESPRLKWGLNGKQALSCVALGSAVNVTIQRVKFINWGTFLPGIECFPCYLGGTSQSSAQAVTACWVDSCIFTQPASGNQDGCTVLSILNNTNLSIDQTATVSNCQFINCWSPTAGQPGDFLYQHCVGAPTVINNIATGCDVFFYMEIGFNQYSAGCMAQIIRNTVTCRNAVFILFDPGTFTCTPVHVVGNVIIMADDPSTLAAVSIRQLFSPGPGTAQGLLVAGNYFSASASNISQPNHFGVYISQPGASSAYLTLSYAVVHSNQFQGFTVGNEISLDASTSVIVARSSHSNWITTPS